MLQLIGIGVGILTVVMGVMAITRRSVKLSGSTTLKDGPAITVGIITLLVGVAIALFCLFGIPLLMALPLVTGRL